MRQIDREYSDRGVFDGDVAEVKAGAAHMTERTYLTLIQDHAGWLYDHLKALPAQEWTPAIARAVYAAYDYPGIVFSLPARYQRRPWIIAALTSDGWLIRYMQRDRVTVDMCRAALASRPDLRDYIQRLLGLDA